MSKWFRVVLILLLICAAGYAEEQPLSPDVRAIPGVTPTPWLRYQNANATNVLVAGSWDDWVGRYPLEVMDGLWTLDTRTLNGAFGQHEYKFIPNGEWEKGENRMLYLNPEGLLERPSEAVFNAAIEGRDEIVVYFRRGGAVRTGR